MVYDISVPLAPAFVQYANNGNFALFPPGQDSGAEVVRLVTAAQSPAGRALVLTANEISGTVGIFEAHPARRGNPPRTAPSSSLAWSGHPCGALW